MTRKQRKSNKQKLVSSGVGTSKSLRFVPYALLVRWLRSSLFNRLLALLLVVVMLFVGGMYGVGQWYIASQKDKPLKYGATFIPSYARRFGLDPQATMTAMINELGIRQFRLVSYWDNIEPVQNNYIFDELDWQFKLAEESGSKVSLAIGLRQPRWPECHMPQWAARMPMDAWSIELKEFMQAVINRYRTSPALESYQLENEFFMKVFGICPDHSRERLIDEYNFVKNIDTVHPVIISRSNNALGLPVGEPQADVSAVSVYKRVWDKAVTKRYIEYPFPAWFYATLAGGGKLLNGNEMIIHELQAESWLPAGFEMDNIADIPEQNKSLNAQRLKDRFEYGRQTGIKEIYLWGVEWWYWRKTVANDPSLWETARLEMQQTGTDNAELIDN